MSDGMRFCSMLKIRTSTSPDKSASAKPRPLLRWNMQSSSELRIPNTMIDSKDPQCEKELQSPAKNGTETFSYLARLA